MGARLVANIKNFITLGRHMTSIKALIKASYPNGYRNFGPDLDKMMMPLNKKYVDTSKLIDQINEDNNNNSNSRENYFLLVLKCLIDYIQWDIKKERENYAKYGVLLFIKLIENYNDNWIEAMKLTNFIKNQSEMWLLKDNSLLQYYGKWILLSIMKKNMEMNIDKLMSDYNSNYTYKYQYLNSLPIKLCTLNEKLIELICKNMVNISMKNKRKDKEDNNEQNNNLKTEKYLNRDLFDLKIILEIILLGLLIEGTLFEGKSKILISKYIIPSLASIIDTKIISIFGISYHNVKYYLEDTNFITPSISLKNKINKLRENNNLFFQDDTIKIQQLIESLYINFLYIIEILSMMFTKDLYEDKISKSQDYNNITNEINEIIENGSISNNNINTNDLGVIHKFKTQERINILPSYFKSLSDKLYSLYYYPYIITSDICLSICRGNNEYTIELITLITFALRYHTIIEDNNNYLNNNNDYIFLNNEPFFITDELIISISGVYDEIPKYILFHETSKYCYSLLRCLHRVLCCCPRVVGISKLVSTLVNLIDVILPLYDLNGTLCSRSKHTEGLITNTRDMEKCALLLRSVAFQVLFDIMCILSETSQVFYVIRVLVKIRDWCGSCLLDLIRRCQRLASQCNILSGNIQDHNSNNPYKQKNRQKFEKIECRNKNRLFSTLSNTTTAKIDDNILADNVLFGINLNNKIYDIDLQIVNPSFWNNSKIIEIANINKKWITGQIGNFNQINNVNNYSNNNININNQSSNINHQNNNLSTTNDLSISSKTTHLTSNKFENNNSTIGVSIHNSIIKTTSQSTIVNCENENINDIDHNNQQYNSSDSENEYDTSESDDETNSIDYDYDDDDDDEYWEVDHKLLELIKLRPTSSIINAQPPTSGILRRTVSSDVNKNTFSKIGSISSLCNKHNSSPPKTFSSIKRVCFAEIAQIY